MSIVVAEGGEAFCLTEEAWSEFLALRASGVTTSVSDFGVGIGDFMLDVSDLTAEQARTLLPDGAAPPTQQRAAA